jgi:DNA-3-methyladenine glycosylase I
MLIDHNWTEILKRRDMYREVFADFDPSRVAKMDEDAIAEISGNKELKLAECRVRCIVENAKCIQKASRSMDLNELFNSPRSQR